MALVNNANVARARWALTPGFFGTYESSQKKSFNQGVTSTSGYTVVITMNGNPCTVTEISDSGHDFRITLDGNEITFNGGDTGLDAQALPFPLYSKSSLKIEAKRSSSGTTYTTVFGSLVEYTV
jgi:hypothetical protein